MKREVCLEQLYDKVVPAASFSSTTTDIGRVRARQWMNFGEAENQCAVEEAGLSGRSIRKASA